ncbi:hypothetical protein PH210_04565 [Paenibacillus sp. BSR1-1]|uniref:hypothetical protein n=1 Tax=Paenibacillus sp. BSR1-1 TaxID=3020845 RepID=UPI0025B00F3E|nr:hypothetical protein [Paenibacillus sp. BSR1-1]MDN3015481.1 hypothetical protein [Paenibacillus sp. BSR1-1]
MKKIIISVLGVIVLSFILGNTFTEAKTRSGGTSRSGSSVSKPKMSAPASSTTNRSPSSSTKNTTTNLPSYSSLTTKYPKSARYFSGNALSKTLLFGSTVLLLNEIYDDEPTYQDEAGNVYTLADLEDMDVQIPEEEPPADSYSETVTFNEDDSNNGATDVIETASSNEEYTSIDDDTYEIQNNPPFNWLWLFLPFAALVIILSYLRRTKK